MVGIDLTGKTVVVTGAAGGLGAETARTLGRAGAAVVVNYHRNTAGAEAVAAQIRATGGRAIAVRADVAEEGQVTAMFETARRELGPVTLVVNNAGREERLAAPHDLEWGDYQQMLDLNLKAIYLTTRAAHADMRQAGWGRVVNIGSIAFRKPFPGSAAYVAAKGAMVGATRGLAVELGPLGVTVNLVAPGWIPVERHASASPEALERLVRETPLGRCGVPADVAGAVLFLCSDLAGFITGVSLSVCGGQLVGE